MGDRKNTPVLQLIGPEGGGKTTLCRLFLDAFTDQSVLAVDATPDTFLTLGYGIPSPVMLASLLQQMETTPFTRESIDWALQDLPVPIPSEGETEILTWGDPPRELTPTQSELLSYGLPRLFGTYDIVVWDGPLGIAASLLDPRDIKPLIVITPNDEAYCQQLNLDKALVLLSKAQATDTLPPTAAEQIQKGNWTFLGKLPPLTPPEKRVQELPAYFQDCFHKLDLPFDLRPRLA